MAAAPQPLKPKRRKRKERYVLQKLLGQGGMGSVYRAEDLELDRVVALKLLHPMLAEDEKYVNLLKREVVVASRISHPNIVRTFDIDELHGVLAISMALVDGESLSSVLAREGPLPAPRASHFARQICSALDVAHRAGVVHRDLKPANLLVDQQGSIYISDFGMAHSPETISGEQMPASDRPGTPRYMSPEQFHALPLDGRSDLFAFGLILYQMLTGQTLDIDHHRVAPLPVDRTTGVEISIPRTVPDPFRKIILRCLRTSPSERYQEAAGILADLPPDPLATSPRANLSIAEAPALDTARLPAKPGPNWVVRASVFCLLIVGVITVAWNVRTSWGGYLEEYEKGMVLMQGKGGAADVESAAEAFANAVRINPRHAPSQLGLARTSLNLWQTQVDPRRRVVAQRAIQAAIELGLRDTTTTLLKADIDIASGDPASALAVLEKLISSETATDDMYRTKSRALLAAGNAAEAVESARKAVELNPQYSLNYNTLGVALKNAGSADLAASAFEKVIELNPASTVGYVNLGAARVDAGRFLDAIAPLEQALRRAPTATQYSNLGTALLYVGSCTSAIEVFRKAVELSPANETFVGNLGDAYFCSGKSADATRSYQQAIQLAEKQLELNPSDYRLAGRLSMYLVKAGRLDAGRARLAEAQRLAPGNAKLLFYESLYWTFQHQYGRAADSRQAAIRAGYSPVVADAERRLYANKFPEDAILP